MVCPCIFFFPVILPVYFYERHHWNDPCFMYFANQFIKLGFCSRALQQFCIRSTPFFFFFLQGIRLLTTFGYDLLPGTITSAKPFSHTYNCLIRCNCFMRLGITLPCTSQTRSFRLDTRLSMRLEDMSPPTVKLGLYHYFTDGLFVLTRSYSSSVPVKRSIFILTRFLRRFF